MTTLHSKPCSQPLTHCLKQTIRDTFSLQDVPKQAYYMGLAGVLPYAATAVSTVYCSWELNHAAHTGAGFILDERTAEVLLHIIEPLQIGYGAVVSIPGTFSPISRRDG